MLFKVLLFASLVTLTSGFIPYAITSNFDEMVNMELAKHGIRSSNPYYYPNHTPVNETYPPWMGCLNGTGPCPGYIIEPCSAENTVGKNEVLDLMEATYYGTLLWAGWLTINAKQLMVMPTNYTINGWANITAFLTGYYQNGTKIGLNLLPPNYTVSNIAQNSYSWGSRVVAWANATAPSRDVPNANTSTPHLWIVELDLENRIINISIWVDTWWYPNSQSSPLFTKGERLVYKNYTLPPFRNYYECVLFGITSCPGYNDPCPYNTDQLLTTETIWLVNNMTVFPWFDQVALFWDPTGVSDQPFLSAYLEGNVNLASYYWLYINPLSGNPSYLYLTVASYWVVQEGYITTTCVVYWTYWVNTETYRWFPACWKQDFTQERRLQWYTVLSDSAFILYNFESLETMTPTSICAMIATACVGEDVQFPVPYGEFKGLSCEEAFNTSITDIPFACNAQNIATTTGNCGECHGYHASIAYAAGAGTEIAHIHCQHAGFKMYDANGNPYPCTTGERRRRLLDTFKWLLGM
jgi:hypothetical protein